MIIYDFDDTIYDGDSSVDFYKYCFSRKPFSAIWSIIVTVFFLPLYIYRIIGHREMKEKIFKFVTKFNNLEELVEDFWDLNEHKIKPWYLNQKKEEDVIISASFDFIVKPMCYRLHLKNVLCTDYNLKTGKIIGINCHGKGKITKFEYAFPGKKMKEAYSDSSVDKPILEYANKGFVVVKDEVFPYENHVFKKKMINYILDIHLMSTILTSVINGILLILLTMLFKLIVNPMYSFTIGYIITSLLGYVIGEKYIPWTTFYIKDLLKYTILNLPCYLIMLYLIYILKSFGLVNTLLISMIVYIPSNYLINQNIFGKGE